MNCDSIRARITVSPKLNIHAPKINDLIAPIPDNSSRLDTTLTIFNPQTSTVSEAIKKELLSIDLLNSSDDVVDLICSTTSGLLAIL